MSEEQQKQVEKTQAPQRPSVHIYFDADNNLKMDYKNTNIYTILGMLDSTHKSLMQNIGVSDVKPATPKVEKAEGGPVADAAPTPAPEKSDAAPSAEPPEPAAKPAAAPEPEVETPASEQPPVESAK